MRDGIEGLENEISLPDFQQSETQKNTHPPHVDAKALVGELAKGDSAIAPRVPTGAIF